MDSHKAVSTGGSPWRVVLDGVVLDGTHDDLHKAVARGYRVLTENPDADVRVKREAEIRLSLSLDQPQTEPEPEPEPTAVEPVLVDDPDQYTSTSEVREAGYGETGLMHLDTAVARPGGNTSIRYDFIDQGADRAISVGRRLPLASRTRELWVEFDVRWSENWMAEIDMSKTNTYSHKLLFAQAIAPGEPNNWTTSDGCSVYRWALLMPSGGSANPPNGQPLIGTPTTTECGGGVELNVDANAADYFDGAWHTIRLHLRHDPGLFEFFVDGQLLGRTEGYVIHPEVVTTALLLGRNKDDGNPSGTESLWWGKVQAWNSDPGW